MRAAATLLAYAPISWFEGPDQRYWRLYVETEEEAGSRHSDEFRDRFLERTGLRDENEIVHAFVRRSRGRAFLCPAYGKVGIADVIPDVVASLPEPLRSRARRLAETSRITPIYHRRTRAHRLPAPYWPLSFFLLFVRSERRVRLRPPGRVGETGYVASLGRARRRLARLMDAALRSGEAAHVVGEIESVDAFLESHDEAALLEMRIAVPEGQMSGGEEPIVEEARARVRSAARGVLFADGVLSGLRPR